MSEYRRHLLIADMRKLGYSDARSQEIADHYEANPCNCKMLCPGHRAHWPHGDSNVTVAAKSSRRPQLAAGLNTHTRVTKCRCGCSTGVSGKRIYATAACRKRFQRSQDKLRAKANLRAGSVLRTQYASRKAPKRPRLPDEDAPDSRSITKYIHEVTVADGPDET